MQESEYEELSPINDPITRRHYWEIAKGLQAVDGLVTSAFLDTEVEAILSSGLDSVSLVPKIKERYYKDSEYAGDGTAEADLVATRIASFLEQEGSFAFTPLLLKSIHQYLFQDVLLDDWIGAYRTVNISKSEEVLFGKSVQYAPHTIIEDQLEFDFNKERKQGYSLPFDNSQVTALSDFTSSLWQTHPFREGNTRTIAVFLVLYLRSMGIKATNAPFDRYSKFFRDALVRSNYADISNGIQPDRSYLDLFFNKLLVDADGDLSALDLNCYQLSKDRVPL